MNDMGVSGCSLTETRERAPPPPRVGCIRGTGRAPVDASATGLGVGASGRTQSAARSSAVRRVALVVSASLQPRVSPGLSDLLAKVRRENGRVVTAILLPESSKEARRTYDLLRQRMRDGEFDAIIPASWGQAGVYSDVVFSGLRMEPLGFSSLTKSAVKVEIEAVLMISPDRGVAPIEHVENAVETSAHGGLRSNLDGLNREINQ